MNFTNNEESESKIPENNNQIIHKKSKLANRQKIIMNNQKTYKFHNEDFIVENLYKLDDLDISESIYRHIENPYKKKINLINMILDSELVMPINGCVGVIKFFNWLSPLNNEYNMGSKDWNIKTIKYANKEKILLQNSISKSDMGKNFYKNYIDLIKKKLKASKIPYEYFEFKSKRFNKIKDIIWAFDKN